MYSSKSILFFMVMVLFFSGCATSTPYRKGYRDFVLRENEYQVYSKGNASTPDEKVFLIGLLRCAEITIDAGYRWFYLLHYEENPERGFIYVPQMRNTTQQFYREFGPIIRDISQPYGPTGFYKKETSNYGCLFIIRLVRETTARKILINDEYSELLDETRDVTPWPPLNDAISLFKNVSQVIYEIDGEIIRK